MSDFFRGHGHGRRRGRGGFAKFEDFGGSGWSAFGGGPGSEGPPGPGDRGPGDRGPGAGRGPGHHPDPGFDEGFGRPGHGHRHGGPPPWRGGRRARRGDIRWALLIALLDGPSHGYELIGRLETRTGGMWRPSAGSVYPTLQLLEDEGLVRGSDRDGKRVYELTEEGRTAATEASERMGRGPWGGAGGIQAELPKAMKTLALALRQVVAAGDESQVAAAVEVITQARQRLYRILAGEPAPTPPAGRTPPAGSGGPAEPPAADQP